MEVEFNLENFSKPIIKKKNFSVSNHKIFKKYSSELYQKYTFELLETLCNKSHFEHKTKILYTSIYFILKFLYKTKNDIYIQNYDLIILVSFYLGIKTVENQNKIPKLMKLKNIYQEKFGNYSNKEIKETELIYIKILNYKINFLTIYDYLIYVFNKNKDYILLQQKELNKMIIQDSYDFCIYTPLELIQKITNNPEITKISKYPKIVEKKIKYNSRENSFGIEIGSNIDESLSTSISSGHQNNNNININLNENNINNSKYKNLFKKIELDNNMHNFTSRKIEPSFKRSNKKYNLNYMLTSVNITRDNIDKSIDEEKEKNSSTFIYNKKSIINLKNKTAQKEPDIEKIENIYKSNIKKKIFRNNNSTYNIKFSCTNNDIMYNISNKKQNVYVKPFIKKEETQKYFTSNKKKEKDIKFLSYKTIKNKKEENEFFFKDKLKKNLFFEENDNDNDNDYFE